MDISCDIIRDLLPLYAEELASDASRALVENHLETCESCVKILEELKKEKQLPLEPVKDSFAKVKNTIRRKRILSVLAALTTLLSLSAFWNTFLHAPFQLTKEQAIEDFYIREDGAVVIDYAPYVTGRSMNGNGNNWYINQNSTRYEIWKAENRPSVEELYGADGIVTEEERLRYENIDIIYGSFVSEEENVKSDSPIPWAQDAGLSSGGSDWNWWYADPAGRGEDILLHDAGREKPEAEDRIQYAPLYPTLVFGGAVLAIVMLVLQKFVKKAWAKELAVRILILSASLVISTVFISGGRIYTSYIGVIDQYWGPMIAMNTVCLTLTLHFWRQLLLLNRQAQGM